MQFWGRVLVLRPKYFAWSMTEPFGWTEHCESERRAGKQPPATLEDLQDPR